MTTDRESTMPSPECTLLVTTALENTWGTSQPIVFLGEWCCLYDRRRVWQARRHEIRRHHWDDRQKLKRDHDRLQRLHEGLLPVVARQLSDLHQADRPVSYWRKIVDPWLFSYIAVLFDRWECLRLTFQDGVRLDTLVLPTGFLPGPPANYSSYISQILGDRWNHALMAEMIRTCYADDCQLLPAPGLDGDVASPGPVQAARTSLRMRVTRTVDRALGRLSGGADILLFHSYFSLSALLRVSLKLRQLPRLYLDEFDAGQAQRVASSPLGSRIERSQLTLEHAPADAFEAFLVARAFRDMPRAYLEDYAWHVEQARQVRVQPKVIATANAHWSNELFKIWSAERVLRGSRLLIMDHGGCFPPAFGTMDFDEDVASIRSVWPTPYHPKQVQLPPNKIVGRRQSFSNETCAVLGQEEPRYSYRVAAYPIGRQTLDSLEMVCSFHAALVPEPRGACQIRPYSNQGWNTRQRYIDRLGSAAVPADKGYRRFLSRARIIVCTYPQTTFSEGMASGQPTILLYPAHLWETHPKFAPLLAVLRRLNIVFDDATAAAAHVNSIWHDPGRWWSSAEVRHVRVEFTRCLLREEPDWLRRWVSFLQGLAGEVAALPGLDPEQPAKPVR
jgi:putative transferase (TIGR04331 family)